MFFVFSMYGFIKYILNEKYIYYWDNKEYFFAFKRCYELLSSKTPEFFSSLCHSIYFSHYNVFPVSLPSCFGFIGTQRIDYIFLLYIIYYVPLIFLIAKNFCSNYYKLFTCFYLAVCLLYTPFIIPTLNGYPDIAGLIPLTVAIIISTKHSIHNAININRMIALGIVLYICFLIRRWYAYTIVSFYISYFITNYLFAYKKRYIENIIVNILIAGTSTIFCVFIFQGGLAIEIATANYYSAYSAYDYGFFNNILNLLDCLPLLLVFVVLFSLFYIIYKKDSVGLFIILLLVFNILLHAGIQRFDIQHRLPIFLFVLLILFRSLIICKNKKIVSVCLVFVVCVNSLNYYSTLFDNTTIKYITQKEKYLPYKHEGYNELIRLLSTIKNLPNVYEYKVSFFSSSKLLCDDMAETILGKIVVYTSHVDSRDGVPFKSLFSKYVIVTDKTQVHLGEHNQYVIKIPNEQIINQKGIGRAYKKISGPFFIGNDCNAYIYEKTRAFTNAEIDDYLNSFKKYSSEIQNTLTKKIKQDLITTLYRK